MNTKRVDQRMRDQNCRIDTDSLTSRGRIGSIDGRSCRYQAGKTKGDTSCYSNLAK